MRKYLLAISLLALFTGSAYADNVSVGTVELASGTSKQISVSLNNTKQYDAFQFDMVLPEGVTVSSGSLDGFDVSLTGRKDNHQLRASKIASNTYRFLVYSMNNATISGSEGALINLSLIGAENLSAGKKTAKIESLVFVEADGKQAKVDGSTFTIQVESKSSESVNIGTYGKKTFCSDKALDFSTFGDKLKAYVAIGYEPASGDGMGGVIWMTRVMDAPAGTGILLKGEPGDYEIPEKESTSTYMNMLNGVGSKGEDIVSGTDTYVNLYLTKNDAGDALIFRTIAGEGRTMSANSAYLQIPKPFKERPASASNSTEAVTISQYGKSTYCSSNDLDFSSFGDKVKAYIATGYTGDGGTIWMTRVNDIPAGTGVFLKGTPGTYQVPTKVKPDASPYSSVYKNMMKGTLKQTTLAQYDGDYKNYYLTKEKETDEVLKFCGVAASGVTLGANKAYLPIPKVLIATSRGLSLEESFDAESLDDVIGIPVMLAFGETTGIDKVRSATGSDIWYNLQGQRIDKPSKKGLYILNGKKVLVK